MTRKSSRFAVAFAVVAIGAGIAGCGSDDEESASDSIDSLQEKASSVGSEASTAVEGAADKANSVGTQIDKGQQKAQEIQGNTTTSGGGGSGGGYGY